MVSVRYFYDEVIRSKDIDKQKYISSACKYYIPIFAIALILLYLTTLCIANITQYLSQTYHQIIIIIIISITINYLWTIFIILFIMSMINKILANLYHDLQASLIFDFRWKDYKFASDYSYIRQFYAYQLYNKYNVVSCPICQEMFVEDSEPKQLLYCGHLYHKICIEEYEHRKWNDDYNKWPYPICKCPLCLRQYHSHFEKYDYDENFHFPLWYKGFHGTAMHLIGRCVWERLRERYRKYQHNNWLQYPGRWNVNYYHESTKTLLI